MKITLEDAYKKSTDHPLQTKDGGHAWGGRQFLIGADGVAMAECQHDGVHDPKLHAALLAHNFNALPEVLAALVELVDQLEGIGIPDWHGAEGLSLDAARTAIVKASTVEIP